jgi:hypothetical protein
MPRKDDGIALSFGCLAVKNDPRANAFLLSPPPPPRSRRPSPNFSLASYLLLGLGVAENEFALPRSPAPATCAAFHTGWNKNIDVKKMTRRFSSLSLSLSLSVNERRDGSAFLTR